MVSLVEVGLILSIIANISLLAKLYYTPAKPKLEKFLEVRKIRQEIRESMKIKKIKCESCSKEFLPNWYSKGETEIIKGAILSDDDKVYADCSHCGRATERDAEYL